jgi:hypothetical protein
LALIEGIKVLEARSFFEELKKIGFEFKKCKYKRSFLVEKNYILTQRANSSYCLITTP